MFSNNTVSFIAAWLEGRGINMPQINSLSEALNVMRDAMKIAPNDTELAFLFTRLAFDAGLTEDSAAVASQLSERETDNANYAGFACKTAIAIGDIEAAQVFALRFIGLTRAGQLSDAIHKEEILRILSEVLIHKKEYQQACTLFFELANNGFNLTACVTLVADTLLANGQINEALNILNPLASSNWSRTFVAASISQFRDTENRMGSFVPTRQFGNHNPATSLSISSLAWYGRFTHQLSEYLFLYIYTKRNNVVLETPDWVGHYFFELDDPLQKPYQHVLRRGQRKLLQDSMLRDSSDIVVNADIFSPGGLERDDRAALSTSILPEAFRDSVQSRLKVRDIWMPYLKPALEKLEQLGSTIVAIHLRRGDRASENNVTSTKIYLDWLSKTWPTLENPVLFLASDDINTVKQDFAKYKPYTLNDLTEPWNNNEYLQDFFILMNSDILGISTGGFAAYASLLNQRARVFLRPSLDNESVIIFAPFGPSSTENNN